MKPGKYDPFLLVLNVLGFAGTVALNALAVTLPLNNKTTGQLADQYPNLFVPAGVTFSIWGLIYLLLAVFVVFQAAAFLKKDETALAAYRRIGLLFFASSLCNMAWIVAWHYEMVALSLGIMALLLGCLLAIYLRLKLGVKGAAPRVRNLVHLPFSVYLGWITIAAIANVTALLVDVNWNRFGLSEQFWAAAVIAVGIIITLAVLIRRQDVYYALVVVWALTGILIKRLAADEPAQAVIVMAIAGIALISLGIITQIVRKRVYSAGAG